MPTIRTTVQPPTGLQILDIDVTAWNRSGDVAVIGDVMVFDMASTEATSIPNNGTTGVFETLIDPATAHIATFACGVVVSLLGGAGADDTKVKVRVQGIVEALVAGTTPTKGQPLGLADGVHSLTNAPTAGDRAVGILLETTATGTVASVYFDGINGVGVA